MTRQDLTEIVMVVDKSGSMWGRAADVVGGFNTFVEEQRKVAGEARLTCTLFDTDYTRLYSGVPLADVRELTREEYRPGGNTALLDAVGKTISEVGARLAEADEAERPGQVIFCIITDGEENSSKEYRLDQVKRMVEVQQSEFGWEFIFIGAGIDAIAAGGGMGVPSSTSLSIGTSGAAQKSAYRGLSAYAASRRTGQKPADLKGDA